MIDLQKYDYKANLHVFMVGGSRFCLDVNSGAVHLLDEPAALFLTRLAETGGNWQAAQEAVAALSGAETAAETAAELRSAEEQGALFTAEEELSAFVYDAPPKAICLNVAHACNMRCRYCFAGQGTFGGEAGIMSLDTAKQTVDFLLEASLDRRNLEIDFFGGEPLMNFEVVKETIRYARGRAAAMGKEIAFTLTTNALQLDAEALAFLIDEGIGLILSLDGRREVNDEMRPAADGSGTYDAVLPRIKAAVDRKPISYYVRGTYTAANLDFSEDFRHLAELGFQNISLEPVTGQAEGIRLTEDCLPEILDQYEKLGKLLLTYEQEGRPVNFFHFNLDVNRGPCLSKRLTGCGAGVEYLAVTPEGDIYPCHQFIGEQDYYMGSVHERKLEGSIIERFARNTAINKECAQCWARFYCGGGCHALAFKENGDLSKPFELACRMQKKRLEVAFYMAARRVEAGGAS